MRVGVVVKVIPDKKIGFIRSEDLKEDVFFHFSKVEKVGSLDLREGDEVEYEINELDKIEKRKLQATRVRRSARPLAMKIQPSDAPELKAHHHPRARRQRPSWRPEKPENDTLDSTEDGES
ncbi:MAG: cold shock domain-containing protein [Planctomycetales bacterium]|nr:cold shock domain-containing protein [Planctomycetales bacterium]